MSDIVWTAREALACAYCWAEFSSPENRIDTPESYWMTISERARNECRKIANDQLLLAVARNQAIALLPSDALDADHLGHLKAHLGLTQDKRVGKILDAVYAAFRAQRSFAGRYKVKNEATP